MRPPSSKRPSSNKCPPQMGNYLLGAHPRIIGQPRIRFSPWILKTRAYLNLLQSGRWRRRRFGESRNSDNRRSRRWRRGWWCRDRHLTVHKIFFTVILCKQWAWFYLYVKYKISFNLKCSFELFVKIEFWNKRPLSNKRLPSNKRSPPSSKN